MERYCKEEEIIKLKEVMKKWAEEYKKIVEKNEECNVKVERIKKSVGVREKLEETEEKLKRRYEE